MPLHRLYIHLPQAVRKIGLIPTSLLQTPRGYLTWPIEALLHLPLNITFVFRPLASNAGCPGQ